ncbi:hypothetical protein KPA96_13885 [Burkholderia cenocepacia]|uniref:hypothetical protein n=1 Tax=Burkholderia cenocepacia TaxID=95486 RepID=UPI002856A19A|nr:hypothetical protein [Burkholderia cenocepacia]MDR8076748.1 hypothetical protein [Burkholderia cenocepacia]
MNELELEELNYELIERIKYLENANEGLRNHINSVQNRCDVLDRENQIIRTAMSGFVRTKLLQLGIAAICMSVCFFFAGIGIGKTSAVHDRVMQQQPLK